MQAQHRALLALARALALDDFLVVGVDEERERRAVGAGGRLDHVRHVALAACAWSKYSSFSPENSAWRVRSKSPRLAIPSSSDQPMGNRYSTSLVPEE